MTLYLSCSCRLELELQLPLLAAGFASQLSSIVASLILPSGKLQIMLPLPVYCSGNKNAIIGGRMVPSDLKNASQ